MFTYSFYIRTLSHETYNLVFFLQVFVFLLASNYQGYNYELFCCFSTVILFSSVMIGNFDGRFLQAVAQKAGKKRHL